MIYIVEDDPNIREIESYALKNSGFDTAEFDCGQAFFAACEGRTPELVILDVMLPEEDGLSILRRMRQRSDLRRVPVIMVTAKATELDAVKGLDSGADDYITKPFGVMEFISRVRAVFRRISPQGEGLLQFEGLCVDGPRRVVTLEGQEVELTYKEFELLRLLLENPGIVLTRNRIMDKIWSADYEGESRTVDVHIKTLRQKLGGYGGRIKTVRGVGYKIE